MVDLTDIKNRLRRQDCGVAENHLEQAASALARGEWESAGAQVRSAVEGLFDRVAELRLNSPKRGGAARKELEARGLLSKKQARFVQAFMDYAGASGSHAGTSSPEVAKGRYLAGVGVFVDRSRPAPRPGACARRAPRLGSSGGRRSCLDVVPHMWHATDTQRVRDSSRRT